MGWGGGWGAGKWGDMGWQAVGQGEAESRCLAWVAGPLAVPSQSPLRPGLASEMQRGILWGLRRPDREGPRCSFHF